MKKLQKTSQKIVIKVGSSVLTGGKTSIIRENLARIVRHIADFSKDGKKVILVSSGAIASGLSLMGFKKRPIILSELQACAALGQNILMQEYSCEFEKFNLKCAQILLTREDFNDRKRYVNIKITIDALLKHKIVPIINENDAVCVEEIKIGDNDTLSAYVAVAIKADGLLILTDIDGLYKKFDVKKRTGELIKEVKVITREIERCDNGTDNISCVGGMSTKVKAAKIATFANIPVILANGLKSELRIDFISGETDGTLFSVNKT